MLDHDVSPQGVVVLRALQLGVPITEADLPIELRDLGMVHRDAVTLTDVGRAWIVDHDTAVWTAAKGLIHSTAWRRIMSDLLRESESNV